MSQVLRDLGISQIFSIPILLTLVGRASLEAAGIIQVQVQPYLDLKGRDVLIGFVDTGIDYRNNEFIYEDNTSKIDFIWDQTIEGESPEDYYFGTEYTNEQINNALSSENPLDIVPHQDTVGHGTFLASVAASRTNDEYIGAAPDAQIIAVKLRKAKSDFLYSDVTPPDQENVYKATDVILGIEYILEKAAELNKPVSICIGLGTNTGGHDGSLLLENYISNISEINGVCICAAARKRSTSGTSYSRNAADTGRNQRNWNNSSRKQLQFLFRCLE